jgi:CTP synthase (UTP-ammonia lyase)
MTDTTHPAPAAPARLALVGERSPHVRAHQRISGILGALRERDGLVLDAYWIATPDAERDPGALAGFDGIWITPGSPYQSMAGAIAAARCARTAPLPFLGTCGGFQHALMEFARSVCGLTRAGHAEYTPDGDDLLMVPLACSLAGHELEVRMAPGSLAERALGADRTIERYHCSYGVSPHYLDLLAGHGMRFTGTDADGEVRAAELPDHPFYLATLFQPELAPGPRPHPIIAAFARAVVEKASERAVADRPAVVSGR